MHMSKMHHCTIKKIKVNSTNKKFSCWSLSRLSGRFNLVLKCVRYLSDLSQVLLKRIVKDGPVICGPKTVGLISGLTFWPNFFLHTHNTTTQSQLPRSLPLSSLLSRCPRRHRRNRASPPPPTSIINASTTIIISLPPQHCHPLPSIAIHCHPLPSIAIIPHHHRPRHSALIPKQLLQY